MLVNVFIGHILGIGSNSFSSLAYTAALHSPTTAPFGPWELNPSAREEYMRFGVSVTLHRPATMFFHSCFMAALSVLVLYFFSLALNYFLMFYLGLGWPFIFCGLGFCWSKCEDSAAKDSLLSGGIPVLRQWYKQVGNVSTFTEPIPRFNDNPELFTPTMALRTILLVVAVAFVSDLLIVIITTVLRRAHNFVPISTDIVPRLDSTTGQRKNLFVPEEGSEDILYSPACQAIGDKPRSAEQANPQNPKGV